MGLLHKVIGARDPEQLQHRRCPYCPGDIPTAGKWSRQSKALVTSSVDRPRQGKCWVRFRVHLEQQEMGSERGLETRQQCGSIQETGSKSGLEMSRNVCPRDPSGREVTYSTGLRSTQAAEPEMSLETSTPTA